MKIKTEYYNYLITCTLNTLLERYLQWQTDELKGNMEIMFDDLVNSFVDDTSSDKSKTFIEFLIDINLKRFVEDEEGYMQIKRKDL